MIPKAAHFNMDSTPSTGQVKKETSCCRIKLRQEVIFMVRKYSKVKQMPAFGMLTGSR